MRIFVLAVLAAFALLASAARADDTKPPVISDVKASAKGGQVRVEARITDETGVLNAIVHHRSAGGKVEDTPMQKNDYDDVFKASFPGSSDTEYWIESSDLLGNGPAMYGSPGKALAVGGKPDKGGAVANKEPSPEEPKEPVRKRERHTRVARSVEAPVIEHRQPSAQPPEGRDFTVRLKIKSSSPVPVAVLMSRQQGAAAFTSTPLQHTEGESYEVVIPGAQAKGTIEYFIAAKNDAGVMTRQGNGDSKSPYVLTFKPPAATPAVASDKPAAGPYQFAHLPLYRVQPGKLIAVRAQIVAANGDLPEHAAVLWRGNDGTDQFTEMSPDPTGGYGGFRVDLPAQDEGGIYYQIIACDAGGTKCGDDTGSKRKWHAAAVASQRGAAQPMSIDVPSSKAPPALPE